MLTFDALTFRPPWPFKTSSDKQSRLDSLSLNGRSEFRNVLCATSLPDLEHRRLPKPIESQRKCTASRK